MAANFEIKKFNKSNFLLWKLMILVILMKNNCLEAIRERSTGITNDKWNEMDGKVIADLHLAFVDGVLSSIVEKKIVTSIWDTLTKLYETKSLYNKIFLKIRLYSLRIAKTTTVANHINTLKTLFL